MWPEADGGTGTNAAVKCEAPVRLCPSERSECVDWVVMH
ncbi:hypothetical protein BFV94_4756 [Alteromonas macleodii]|uniref:Uncharacterized protein n=1 Tax=Alteromonas macleodii TaxID=28108 RepID=A0AB36FKE3_ALTMA|nr:hypothetical protein BFV95_4985 [Alteromonas macleodii]OES24605.1 hypothetical protein BFV94_4756 [Alteromonas macleodii]OES25616.1 hypothetical protein BFV93_4370 [Alteromonas macleodii]OES39024.1 hypothetical protein BFV96_4425 [Alteromonas macleodii]